MAATGKKFILYPGFRSEGLPAVRRRHRAGPHCPLRKKCGGSALLLAQSPDTQPESERINQQPKPDKAETDQTRRRERFTVEDHRYQEENCRGEALHAASTLLARRTARSAA